MELRPLRFYELSYYAEEEVKDRDKFLQVIDEIKHAYEILLKVYELKLERRLEKMRKLEERLDREGVGVYFYDDDETEDNIVNDINDIKDFLALIDDCVGYIKREYDNMIFRSEYQSWRNFFDIKEERWAIGEVINNPYEVYEINTYGKKFARQEVPNILVEGKKRRVY